MGCPCLSCLLATRQSARFRSHFVNSIAVLGRFSPYFLRTKPFHFDSDRQHSLSLGNQAFKHKAWALSAWLGTHALCSETPACRSSLLVICIGMECFSSLIHQIHGEKRPEKTKDHSTVSNVTLFPGIFWKLYLVELHFSNPIKHWIERVAINPRSEMTMQRSMLSPE